MIFKEKMDEEERNLYFFLLNSPLFPDGSMPEWYRTIKACKILGIPPWEFDDDPVTQEVKEMWKERALVALQIEWMVNEFKKKNPTFFGPNTFSNIYVDEDK